MNPKNLVTLSLLTAVAVTIIACHQVAQMTVGELPIGSSHTLDSTLPLEAFASGRAYPLLAVTSLAM